MKSSSLVALAIAVSVFAFPLCAQLDPTTLAPVGYHPSDVTYFNTPYFSNALFHGGEWYEFEEFDFGTRIDFNGAPAQFVNGYPQFLNPGKKLRAPLFGLNIEDPNRPAAWPERGKLSKGRIIVTWTGDADIRLKGATFESATPFNNAGGRLVNGRRIYTKTNGPLETLEIHEINDQVDLTEIRVWLAAPDDPDTPLVDESLTQSLENQLFHPLFLDRIADEDWEYIRFMDWGKTNASPQKNWSDRRLPHHAFQAGVVSRRSPLDDDEELPIEEQRETGVAYEHMVALCNATGRNMWINIPHLASDDYIRKLANLIRFGSDGVEPFTSEQVNPPPFPPLDPGLKVYVEYSNEIWSSGFAFPQGNWAEAEAIEAGDINTGDPQTFFPGRARFDARRFLTTWRIFEDVFDGTSRLVRVAATFTANDTYTDAFLRELNDKGAAAPATEPDVLAVTTYFGNGIQDFVDDQGFTAGKPFDDPYWTSPQFATDMTTAFDEWKRRMLSGDAVTGAGPDATGIGGGFNANLRTMTTAIFGAMLPIIAYEGGPSLFTDTIDSGGTIDDDGVTIFVEAMNRDPRIADVYRVHLDLARSKGLWTHTPYTDTSTWSRFGQWGHMETLDQDPADEPKYALMREHFDLYSTVRHIDNAVGTVPSFTTAAVLDSGIVGLFYTADIVTSGGNGARSATVVGSFLDPGLTVSAAPTAGNLRITGTPTLSRKNFLLVRVIDSDSDPSWRIFTLETFGGSGTIVQSNFTGDDPGLNGPWTPTFVLAPNVNWSGWDAGAGASPAAGDNAFTFSVSGGGSGADTLSNAITEQQFLTATVDPDSGSLDLRGAQMRFSIRRVSPFSHAPVQYAVFTSATGFTEPSALFTSAAVDKENFDDNEHVLTFPSTSAFNISGPLEIRIYGFGAEFDGHRTSLSGFKLTQNTAGITVPAAPTNLAANAQSTTQVALSWTASAGATGYEIARRSGSSEIIVGSTSGATTFTDTGAPAGKANLYRVRALNGAVPSPFSGGNLATTVAFTDDPLVVGSTKVKGTHLLEIRSAIDAVRATALLAPASYTNPITAGTTKIAATHFFELRSPLTSALSALGLPVPSFSSGVSAPNKVLALHLTELRNAVK